MFVLIIKILFFWRDMSISQQLALISESPELSYLQAWQVNQKGHIILCIDFKDIKLARYFWEHRANLVSAMHILRLGIAIIFFVGEDRFGRASHPSDSSVLVVV